MATLEPELVETDARGLTATALRTAPRRSLIVLLTSLDAAPIEEGLLPYSPVSPTATQSSWPQWPTRISHTWLRLGEAPRRCTRRQPRPRPNERHRTAEQLQRHGVTVVDAVPDNLAPALADAYRHSRRRDGCKPAQKRGLSNREAPNNDPELKNPRINFPVRGFSLQIVRRRPESSHRVPPAVPSAL